MAAWPVPGAAHADAPILLRMAAQVIEARSGKTYGWELLARRAGMIDDEGASSVLAHLREPFDWMCLDVHMLGEAVAFAGQAPSGRIFVNLAAMTARHPRLFDRFLEAAAVSAAALTRKHLTVEVHENFDGSVADLDRLIEALHQCGLRAAMDDFRGTRECWRKVHAGWDVVKLDHATMALEQTLAVLDALREADWFERSPTLIVEGVESEADRDAVFEAGAHAVQGWIIGRPQLLGTA